MCASQSHHKHFSHFPLYYFLSIRYPTIMNETDTKKTLRALWVIAVTGSKNELSEEDVQKAIALFATILGDCLSTGSIELNGLVKEEI